MGVRDGPPLVLFTVVPVVEPDSDNLLWIEYQCRKPNVASFEINTFRNPLKDQAHSMSFARSTR